MKVSGLIALLFLAAAGGASICDPRPVAAASEKPARYLPDVLGQDGRITFTPAISPDGQTLYFTQANCRLIWECPQELFRVQKKGSAWGAPEKLPFSAGDRVEWPSFSPDGATLLFSWATERERHSGRKVYEDFDLYRLDLTTEGARPEALDEPDINRLRGGKVRTLRFVNNETAPTLTADGDLFFWTERLDGMGNRDVYVAPAAPGGGFEKARALPSPINSPDNDAGVWVHPNGRLMLVNYEDRGGEGGTDIFVSTRQGDQWSEPRNLGPGINSRSSEFAARITPDGKEILFTSDRPVGGAKGGLFQVWSLPVAAVPILAEAMEEAQRAPTSATH